MTEDGDKYKLEISDLKSIDAGVYSVKLENSIGEVSQQAKLLVSSKIIFDLAAKFKHR